MVDIPFFKLTSISFRYHWNSREMTGTATKIRISHPIGFQYSFITVANEKAIKKDKCGDSDSKFQLFTIYGRRQAVMKQDHTSQEFKSISPFIRKAIHSLRQNTKKEPTHTTLTHSQISPSPFPFHTHHNHLLHRQPINLNSPQLTYPPPPPSKPDSSSKEQTPPKQANKGYTPP